MTEFIYQPKGVCSTKIVLDINDNLIERVKIMEGCPGNSLGLNQLLKGMEIDYAINQLLGITCGRKKTSCPDQIAKALIAYKNQL